MLCSITIATSVPIKIVVIVIDLCDIDNSNDEDSFISCMFIFIKLVCLYLLSLVQHKFKCGED